jgi:hypothetical protein
MQKKVVAQIKRSYIFSTAQFNLIEPAFNLIFFGLSPVRIYKNETFQNVNSV